MRIGRRLPAVAYKIQTREAGANRFTDATEWLTCAECIERMRAMSPFSGDLQVIDEHRHVVATTFEEGPAVADEMSGNLAGKAS